MFPVVFTDLSKEAATDLSIVLAREPCPRRCWRPIAECHRTRGGRHSRASHGPVKGHLGSRWTHQQELELPDR